MATYTELRAIWGNVSNDGLKAQVEVAVIIAAQLKLSNGASTAAEVKWASNVLSNPKTEGKKALMAVIAANNTSTIAAIQGATDATVQAKVDIIIDGLVVASGA